MSGDKGIFKTNSIIQHILNQMEVMLEFPKKNAKGNWCVSLVPDPHWVGMSRSDPNGSFPKHPRGGSLLVLPFEPNVSVRTPI